MQHGAVDPLDDPLEVAPLEAQSGEGPAFESEPGQAHRGQVGDRGRHEGGDPDVGAARLAPAGAEVLENADHEHHEGRPEARARDHAEGLGSGEGAGGEKGERHRRDRRAREQEAGPDPAGADAAGEAGHAGRAQHRAHAARPALEQLEGQDEEEQPGDGGEEAEGHGHGARAGSGRHGQKSFRESRRMVTGPWFTRATSIMARKTPVATFRPEGRSLDTRCSYSRFASSGGAASE